MQKVDKSMFVFVIPLTDFPLAHPRIFRLFMKGKFDAYVLRPLAKRVKNQIVGRLQFATLQVISF